MSQLTSRSWKETKATTSFCKVRSVSQLGEAGHVFEIDHIYHDILVIHVKK